MEFKEFPKMSRLSRETIITEKIDGTNASIFIQAVELEESTEDPTIVWRNEGYTMRAGSRTRWITPKDDNYGFANWAYKNASELIELGEGHHFGEWWGSGIQRGYNLPKGEKRFSLFNVSRWKIDSFEEKGFEAPPKCCHIVPILHKGPFDTNTVTSTISALGAVGSFAAPGFMNPEGIVVWHTAANIGFKKTIKNDESPKSLIKE